MLIFYGNLEYVESCNLCQIQTWQKFLNLQVSINEKLPVIEFHITSYVLKTILIVFPY